ncbi:uncharacterized protein LOC142336544 isoform X2 [Convolutriloba macropyga]|uniref:uncharacterized protein LOC142336544 isoform X2 n=1 Tax=Convolutriloba macropyga TaxID=536237 RepID=UPI003F526882
MVPCPDIDQVMRKYSQTSNKTGALSFSGFLQFLFSEKCSIVKRVEKKVNMDMAYPLNHYYVNSSHNTYLEGNQLTSACSVEAYVRALKLGTRLLELDVHPGPKDCEPVIKHLSFPTSPVSFREVCQAINEHAFSYSSYPLILSIEDHCESDSEAKKLMNEILVEVFGNLLFTDEKLQNNQLLPSPEELKGYVIVKNKRLRQENFINVCRGVTAKNLGEVFVSGWKVCLCSKLLTSIQLLLNYSSFVKGGKNPKKCQPNFVTSIAKTKFYSLCSNKPLEDSEFVKKCQSRDKLRKEEIGETCSEALVEWTKRSQVRVYPANTQVLSGNFDPRDAWMCGVQYASLNLQTVDLYFIFNRAMFARNGGCGYVLKPCYLRPRNGTFFNPLALETRNKETLVREILKKRYLNVHILGGAHLPRKFVNGKFAGDMVDVYVKVSLYDKIGKSKCQSFRTRTIKDNDHMSEIFGSGLKVADKPSAESVGSNSPREASRGPPEDRGSTKRSLDNGFEIETNWNKTVEKFDDLGIKETLLRGIYSYGFENPSAIQQRAILPAAQGRDVIAQAQSGTGKTATFAISVLERVQEDDPSCQALIMAPTRELVIQIRGVVYSLAEYMSIRVAFCVGGNEVSVDAAKIQDAQVVVGTPGRVFDLMNRRMLKTDKIHILVLDEADEMLSRGFKEQIVNILKKISEKAQIVLMSATMPPDALELSQKFMQNPVQILVKKEELTLDGIRQFYVNCEKEEFKCDTLCDLYETMTITQAVIFCNTKRKVIHVQTELTNAQHTVSAIHSDMPQKEREVVMNEFRTGSSRVLIATDLIARGIDVQQVSVVINFDLPARRENYIHRIGRSGRFGRKGVSINFVTKNDVRVMKDLEDFYHTKIEELPTNVGDLL